MRIAGWVCAVLAVSAGLTACTEKPQTTGQRKADTPAFQGPNAGHAAGSWKVGDASSWDQQLKKRAQGQNEKARIGAQ